MTSPEHLPLLASLREPSALFTSTAPYILTLSFPDGPHLPSMIVNCSHEPTLKLLKTYLERWAKADSMTLTLVESNVFPRMTDCLVGTFHDLAPERGVKIVNPTVILAFIEGVVGYHLVHTTGSYWMYRRTTAFA
ncbi:hypothetical protein IW261DRAFT_1133701 [Armillaria novae-zelandiae]|uniref:Uncharacterized protein n=1 Tax=Armillaria novae-zelandiae TaxID=153914 RepID=A0AA39PAK5_9AGAR|nr:hypothetical protein IW261DRAFT_1133701 [Armillaria novae-zelandiae]